MDDTIRLLDLQFFAVVGDLPHERTTPQPLSIDLEVRTDLSRAGRSDRLADGLDYRELYERVDEAVRSRHGEPPRLLETVAERIADRVLALEGVEEVRVRCRKPRAVLAGPLGTVEIEIRRP